jgi:LuxR family maltose regulon positive regulatory protein
MNECNEAQIKFSARELEILKRISVGLSDKEIAGELLLSLSTIKWYNRKIYSKLNVNNRTQAVARSYQLHIIEQ